MHVDMMPPDNGRIRNVEEWIRQLDEKYDGKLDRILSLLGSKADADRVDKIEKRTRHIAAKQIGFAATASAATLWIKSQFLN